MRKSTPLHWGIAGSVLLLILYFGILTLANSFTHAVDQFGLMWYWILLLSAGFGLQLGLYRYIRIGLHQKMNGARTEIAATGGVSTGSMIACCAHHVADVLPILGLGAAAMFLTQYQTPFILLGVFSNLVGITIMLNLIQKHNLAGDNPLLQQIMSVNTVILRNVAIVVSGVVVLSAFGVTALSSPPSHNIAANDLPADPIELPALNNSENNVSIDVNPIDFSYTKPVNIAMALNTHQGSLDFELDKISVLVCEQGMEFEPVRWEGSAPGGHHRRGTLTFPALNHEVSQLTLTIKNVYGVQERTFEWSI